MDTSNLSLSALVGRKLFAGEDDALARLMLGAYVLVADARPFIGVLGKDGDSLLWTAGGAEFCDLLHAHAPREIDTAQVQPRSVAPLRLSDVLNRLGVAPEEIDDIADVIGLLDPGSAVSYRHLLRGREQRSFRLVLFRRRDIAGGHVQFSIHEMTGFERGNAKMREISRQILAAMESPFSKNDPRNLIALLNKVENDLNDLFSATDDRQIAIRANHIATGVSAAANRLVDILNAIDTDGSDGGHTGKDRVNESCPPSGIHCVLGNDWQGTQDLILARVGGELALKGEYAHAVRSAHEFVSNSTLIFIIAPCEGEYYVLSGPQRGEIYSSIPDLVRGIEVGVNSRHGAETFFSSLGQHENQTRFAVAGENMEVWGRPGLGMGWQAMIADAYTQGVDVRAMFHGLKNLWLHMQVLHVVKTRADVQEVRDALLGVIQKIHRRIAELKVMAQPNAGFPRKIRERVAGWFQGARRISDETGMVLDVRAPEDVLNMNIVCYGGQMEDTLSELVRNAHHSGARHIFVNAGVKGRYLEIEVVDDGRGMSPEKLAQAHKVIEEGRFDPVLSARPGGSGYGLLGAAQSVGRFVDGQLRLEPAAGRRGLKVALSFRVT
ncbi:histidine kinase/DNA gyrase B/HSP90-like ATPase [Varunaivibrio sulfuroxidans]|uniref:Histidine kinase/DNA gyrase B/HSP90-like ATPase n=2 Tax=Varunaivibrio sulfuroxidans TaxID=1773489 RepID=A0A4R3J4Y8_9PROT|nr:histidine kinase/DNA gyrase B/HSP90-like ATPase [Varunaivibrio sulfuroxidans]